jgi:PAS domain S-box-containing protein
VEWRVPTPHFHHSGREDAAFRISAVFNAPKSSFRGGIARLSNLLTRKNLQATTGACERAKRALESRVPAKSERVREAEEKIAQARRQLRLLTDVLAHMHQGLCMYDQEGNVAVSNERYAEIIGLPSEAVRPGVSGRELIEQVIEAGHFAGKTPDEVESELWRSVGPDSADSSGNITRGDRTFSSHHKFTDDGFWVVTHDDITAQVEAENALRKSQSRLNSILEALPDCVQIFDAEGKMVYINSSGLRLFEAPDIASLSRPGFSEIPPEYRQSYQDLHARVIAGESFVERMEIVALSGNRRQVEVHATPFSLPDGSPARLCIARDISGRQEAEDALRKSEERLRLVQDATGLADFEAAADGAAICSDRLLEQLGLKGSPNRLEFEQLVELLHPEDRKRFETGIDASLETGEYFQSEFRIIRPDTGETRWILSHTKTERDEAGNPVRTIGAHLDITKRKEAEEAIRESEERFRLAAEAAGLGVWDYDSAAERPELSERFREILGLEPGTDTDLTTIM